MIEVLSILPDFSTYDLYAPWRFGFPIGTIVVIIALVFVLVRAVLGYNNGILLEAGSLITIVLTVIALRYAGLFLEGKGVWYPGGLIFSSIYMIGFILLYRVVYGAVRVVGSVIRDLPIIGFLDGLLGAASGAAWGILLVLAIQLMTNVDITGATLATVRRLDEIRHIIIG